MGKKDAPDVPDTKDYIALAREQSDLAKGLIQEQTRANRPDQYTPYGTTLWEDLGGGRWRQDVTLPEASQAALEAQQRTARGRSELAESLVGRAGEELGSPISWTPMAANEVAQASDARQAAEDAMYGRTTSRLDPMWEQREQEVYSQLWNQGLRPGDEAWDNAMSNLGRERTDAYQTAAREAAIFGGREAERDFGMDLRRRQTAIAEELQRRGATINEISALMSGQQVSLPNMPGVPRAGVAPPPDLIGAAQAGSAGELARYNADQMRDQGLLSGLTQLGTAAIWAPFMFGG